MMQEAALGSSILINAIGVAIEVMKWAWGIFIDSFWYLFALIALWDVEKVAGNIAGAIHQGHILQAQQVAALRSELENLRNEVSGLREAIEEETSL